MLQLSMCIKYFVDCSTPPLSQANNAENLVSLRNQAAFVYFAFSGAQRCVHSMHHS